MTSTANVAKPMKQHYGENENGKYLFYQYYSECSTQAVINPIDVYNSTTTYTVIYSILVHSLETPSWRHDLLSLCWSLLSACGFLNHWTVGFGTPLTLQVKVTVSPSLAVRSLLEVSNIVGGTKYQIISCYNIC